MNYNIKRLKHITNRILVLSISLLCANEGFGQTKVVTGVVMDSVTNAPLQNVSVRVKNDPKGSLSDSSGKFRITVDKAVRQVLISNTGYKPFTLQLTGASEQHYTVRLMSTFTRLKEVVVKYKKPKYRNKNNPAVELIRQVIDHKKLNQVKDYPFASYREYEKLQLSLDNLPRRLTNAKLLKHFHFLFENVDTSTKFPGKRLIPVYIAETLSDNYFRRRPEKKKTIIVGQKSVNYGEFIDMKGISNIVTRMYEPINIYDNNISLFTTQFMSPVAEVAPTFYMYFIRDTVVEDGIQLVKLAFMPRNPDDLLFRGTLYVTLDGHYAIKKVELMVSPHVNLNFVREFNVTQGFQKDTSGRYFLTESDMVADFGLNANGAGVFGERAFSYTQFAIPPTLPDSVFDSPGKEKVAAMSVAAATLPDSVWNRGRSIPLTTAEAKAYRNVDSLTGLKSYKRALDYITLLVAGYKQAGPFEIGPVGTFYSFNGVEGFKPRFGGRSTTHLSKRYYVESYVAYGLKDQKWKYYLGGTYSLNNQSIYKYPYNYLRASYQKDTKLPGEQDSFVDESSSFLSFKRGDDTKYLYNDIFNFEYIREFGDHFSYDLHYRYWRQHPGGSIEWLYEQSPNQFDSVTELTTSELSGTLRWAPHEQYYEGKVGRIPVANKYPIFTFRYAHGFKGLLGGEYNYSSYHLNIYKRVYLSPFGYSDITLDGGFISGKLPFPLLYIPWANQSYAYYIDEYNLMNFEEFVADKWAGVDIDHYFDGFFLNKIPLLKKLKLREVVEAKILFGGVSSENNPLLNPAQMKFPTTNGVTSTFTLNGHPYIEASAGIGNIFKVLRLDLVHRFTYLDHANITSWGIRGRVKFDF
jgi:hypothetical protein